MRFQRNSFLIIVAAVFLLAFPFIVESGYVRHLAVMAGIYVILAMSYNLIVGYVGALSLGHHAFFGIGAYTSTLLVMKANIPFALAILSAGLLSAVFAVLIAVPSFRLSYHSFAIGTLGFGVIIYQVLTNWVALTNGPMGITGIPKPSFHLPGLGELRIETIPTYYYFILVLVALTLLTLHRMVHSRIGRAFMAVRENETLAETFGVDALKYKIMAFAIGAFFAGVAGSAYAHYIGFIAPDLVWFYFLILLLVMVIAGGAGTFYGVVAGAIIFTALPEILRMAPEIRDILYGAILIMTVIYAPEGLGGVVKRRVPRPQEEASKKGEAEG